MKLGKKNKQKPQKPKGSHHRVLKDLKDTEIETLWFGF